jgi:MFS family permease
MAMNSPSSASKYRDDLVDQSHFGLSKPLLDDVSENIANPETNCCSFVHLRRWSMLIIILLSLLNFLCRFTYAGVLSQLQEQFQKTDGEMGFTQTAFVMAYMLAAPIFGYLNDLQMMSCRSLVTVSCFIFSCAAFCTGLSTTYLQFLASRAVLGVGEAGFSVLAPIIIKALYEGSGSQPTALALYYSSTAVGSALGFVVGGTVGGYWGWRYAFFAAGPPGILLSFVFLFSAQTDSANSRCRIVEHQYKPSGMIADIATLSKISSYVFATFGFASLTFAISGLAAFMPLYLSRTTDAAESVASTAFGVVACVSGVIGPFSGNLIAKHLLRKRANAYLHICFIGLALSVPFGLASVLIPFFDVPYSVVLCYASSFVAQTCFYSIMSPNLVTNECSLFCNLHALFVADLYCRVLCSASFQKNFMQLHCM